MGTKEDDILLRQGIGKCLHKYEGRDVKLFELTHSKVFTHKIVVAEGGRMTLEKTKFYKSRKNAEKQFGYIAEAVRPL